MEKIKEFIEQGGTIVAVGGAATAAAAQFKLPLANHLSVSGTDYYVPGSVLQVAVDPKNPVAHGYGDKADIFFDNSEVWKINPTAAASAPPMRVVAWFANGEPLRRAGRGDRSCSTRASRWPRRTSARGASSCSATT